MKRRQFLKFLGLAPLVPSLGLEILGRPESIWRFVGGTSYNYACILGDQYGNLVWSDGHKYQFGVPHPLT